MSIFNIYDIPCISPSYDNTKQCSKIVESFVDKNKNNNKILKSNNYLWTFIEDNTPNYIKQNINLIIKFYNDSFNIIVLTKNNINKYLTNLPFNMNNIDIINMNKKIDYIKYALLYNYGGLWMNSSVLLMNYINFRK